VYRFQERLFSKNANCQQIVTIHFRTATSVREETPATEWDKFVPEQKLAALHKYDPKLVGHPPFGR
jgi:hypothetical protein